MNFINNLDYSDKTVYNTSCFSDPPAVSHFMKDKSSFSSLLENNPSKQTSAWAQITSALDWVWQKILFYIPIIFCCRNSAKIAKKQYQRSALVNLSAEQVNQLYRLENPPTGISNWTKNCTCYAYNSEGIRDYGWGCAWRTIQTCLSSLNLEVPPFADLFHFFGRRENLMQLYMDSYGIDDLSREWTDRPFAPYDLSNGWAEPFIGQMVLHHYQYNSQLELINSRPTCYAPAEVFKFPPLNFEAFKQRVESHFTQANPPALVLDDGKYAFNIVGFGTISSSKETLLWIYDPHIEEGVGASHGLYTITLDEWGHQIACSVNEEQKSNMFNQNSYRGIDFQSKAWMILFPSND